MRDHLLSSFQKNVRQVALNFLTFSFNWKLYCLDWKCDLWNKRRKTEHRCISYFILPQCGAMTESHTLILVSFLSCCNNKNLLIFKWLRRFVSDSLKTSLHTVLSLSPSLGEKDNRYFHSNSFLSGTINKNLLRRRIASNVCACLWLNFESFFNQVTGKLHDEDGTNCSAKAIHRL